MTSIAVVTSFSPRGYEVYGRRMIETLDRYWPKDVPLYVYYEGSEPPEDAHERAIWCPLDKDEDRARFAARHQDHPTNYRRQPVRFANKVFAVTAAPRDTDWLMWLDGDFETVAPVTHELLSSCLPDGVVAAHMGREWWKHTETGLVAYRCFDQGLLFLDDMRKMYTLDKVLTLPEWHDSMAFDHLRRIYERAGHKFHDLCAHYHGPGLDVLQHTPLGSVMRHYKGPKQKLMAYGAVA